MVIVCHYINHIENNLIAMALAKFITKLHSESEAMRLALMCSHAARGNTYTGGLEATSMGLYLSSRKWPRASY